MKSKLLLESPERTWVLVFATGDEVISKLTDFAREEGLAGTRFTGIGGLSEAVLGYFRWEKKQYERIPVKEQVELLSLAGDIAVGEDGPRVHAHVVFGRSDGTALGGHLLEGHVRPTLELTLTDAPRRLVRRHDPASGLALIDLDREGP
jgi:predicted DNA-binding protein with PD1-like motif